MRADDVICAEIRPLLSDFVDGEMAAAEEARVKAHLLLCADCAAHLAFLRLGKSFVSAAYPLERPSFDLSARIAQATYARPTFGARFAAFFRPAPVRLGLGTALAAGIVAVVVVPVLNRPSVNSSEKVAQLPSAPVKTNKNIAKSPTPAKRQIKAVEKTASAPAPRTAVPPVVIALKPRTESFVTVNKPDKTESISAKSALPQTAKITQKPLNQTKLPLPKIGVQHVALLDRTVLPFRHIAPGNLARPEIKHSPITFPPQNAVKIAVTTPEIPVPDTPRAAAVPVEKPENTFSPASDIAPSRGRPFARFTLAGAGVGATPGGSTIIGTRPGRQNAALPEGASYALVSAPVK